MFHDDIRALTAKKYEILGELELAKAAILCEMSSVDKCTLTRLREILDHYDRLEKSVIEKVNAFELKANTFIGKNDNDFEQVYKELEGLSNRISATVTRKSSFVTSPLFVKTGEEFFPLWNEHYAQSVVWVDSVKCFFVGFSSRNESEGTDGAIAKYDENFNLVSYAKVACGHCNDMTYCPETNKIYIAAMDTGTNNRTIVCVDPMTLKVVFAKPIDGVCWAISYDETYKRFVALINERFCLLDLSLDLVSEYPLEDFNDRGFDFTKQGSFFMDGHFYLVCEEHFDVAFVRYGNNGQIIDYFLENFGVQETEGACIKDGKLYTLSGQNYISVFVCDLVSNSSNSLIEYANSGKRIVSGEDMNTFMFLPGKYFCASGNEAKTLLNMPPNYSGGGFTLYVVRNAFDRFSNVIVTNTADIYVRECTPVEVGTRWRRYKPLRDTGEQLKVRGTFGGHMTNNGKTVWFSAPHDGWVYGSKPQIVSGTITVRQGGNYLSNDLAINPSNFSEILIDFDACSFMFRMTFATPPANSANNSECSIYVNCMVEL